MSVSTLGTGTAMTFLTSIMTREEIEELVIKAVKEQKSRVMPSHCDRASYHFTLDILVVTVPRDVQTHRINYYKGQGDPGT